MDLKLRPLVLAVGLGVSVAAIALSGMAQNAPAQGYLGANVPDGRVFIPPPPALGSVADVVDVTAYERTRALKGSPRWDLAAKDAVQTPAAVLADFDCAVGVNIDQATAPKLMALMTRVGRDIGASVNKAKDHFKRPRPFTRIPGPICAGVPEEMAKSWSYPSGHTTGGWTYALILAELAPDRASEILERGREYGESRVVCGVHWVSDVEAGRTNGAGLVAALHADPGFTADLAAARAELAALRKTATARPDAAQCKALDELASPQPWIAP